MCDESFSINYTAEIPADVDKGWFMFFITLLNHFYWFSGATLGGIFGSLIKFNTGGLEFVMTAMFVVIFMEQWLKEKKHTSAIIGLVLSALCLLAVVVLLHLWKRQMLLSIACGTICYMLLVQLVF